jgi:hypothetical protein
VNLQGLVIQCKIFLRQAWGILYLPLAPIREQKLITEKLHEDFMIIGILKEKLVKQIGELQKYRQALITAAVTGKIDVREEFAQGVA